MKPSPKTVPLFSEPVAGMLIAGKVRLEKLLRKGGMGSVWIGRHLGLDLPVAVKFMAGNAEEALARFQREARAAAAIRSSNVVKIHDYGIDQGLPYIVMELMEGEDLGARLRRIGRMSLAEAEKVLIPVARGLERAHEAKLVHRDLKPENIFMAREGDEEIPKILDFGIAKTLVVEAEAKEVTQEGSVLGTPYYMSPEQARGRTDIDHRADLWSLGVILFRLVTGKRPFEGKALGDVLVQICSEPIPRASGIVLSLPQELDRFFDRALARDPAERFPSAREFARAFSAVVQAHASTGDSIAPPRSFDGQFDMSSALPPARTGQTGPLMHTGQSGPMMASGHITLGPAMHSSVMTAAPQPSRGPLVAILGLVIVVLIGAVVAMAMMVSKNASKEQASAPQPSAAPSATPTAAPSATAAAPEAPASAAADESIEILPPAQPTLASSDGKTAKPLTSGTTKKPARDLGY